MNAWETALERQRIADLERGYGEDVLEALATMGGIGRKWRADDIGKHLEIDTPRVRLSLAELRRVRFVKYCGAGLWCITGAGWRHTGREVQ